MNFRLVPPSASTMAPRVDAVFWGEVAICSVFAFAIAALIVAFAVRYREGNDADRTPLTVSVKAIEAAWIAGPLVLALGMFAAGALVFFELRQPPEGAMEVIVVGKQWMWKLQHPGGRREINELHVPRGRPVKLIMTSQDVIHSFFVPAFRIKQDVLPGRFTTAWFEATRTGVYHLFCAEYCGTDHSGMVGRVVVLEPEEYQRWLAGELPGGGGAGDALALGPGGGRGLFERLGCQGCHTPGPMRRGPDLAKVFGSLVTLKDGAKVKADEAYLRESILEPTAKMVRGYDPIMPSFKGRLSQAELGQLVDYLRTLGGPR